MEIIEFYYNESEEILEITFTTEPDGGYLNVELSLDDAKLYSPIILEEEDLNDVDFGLLVDILNSYYDENPIPSENFF
tara:strand:+ start:4865 stop:5098 length:234 start_codon:yes stop_codon:yes gene_type:complete